MPDRPSNRRPDDAAVGARLREPTSIRRRFDYPRLHILLTVARRHRHEPQEVPPALAR